MKFKAVLAIFVLCASFFTGCAKQPTSPGTTTPATTLPPNNVNKPTGTADVVTTASIVDNAAAFQKAISRNGTWIICLTKDLAVDKELLLEGEYKNGKKDANGKDIIQRKVALYAQDEKRNITARYTLTAPKLTVTSPEASLQHGTFKGDIYVSVNNFQLIGTKVEGNVYFTTDEAKNTFKMDKDSSVTGKQELKK